MSQGEPEPGEGFLDDQMIEVSIRKPKPIKGWHIFALGAIVGFLLPKILGKIGTQYQVPGLAPDVTIEEDMTIRTDR